MPRAEGGGTYLRTEVLNCPSWGPAPRRWLWVQTWPSLLWYLQSEQAAGQWGKKQLGREMCVFGVTAVGFTGASHDSIGTFCHRRSWLRGRSSFWGDAHWGLAIRACTLLENCACMTQGLPAHQDEQCHPDRVIDFWEQTSLLLILFYFIFLHGLDWMCWIYAVGLLSLCKKMLHNCSEFVLFILSMNKEIKYLSVNVCEHHFFKIQIQKIEYR